MKVSFLRDRREGDSLRMIPGGLVLAESRLFERIFTRGSLDRRNTDLDLDHRNFNDFSSLNGNVVSLANLFPGEPVASSFLFFFLRRSFISLFRALESRATRNAFRLNF